MILIKIHLFNHISYQTRNILYIYTNRKYVLIKQNYACMAHTTIKNYEILLSPIYHRN